MKLIKDAALFAFCMLVFLSIVGGVFYAADHPVPTPAPTATATWEPTRLAPPLAEQVGVQQVATGQPTPDPRPLNVQIAQDLGGRMVLIRSDRPGELVVEFGLGLHQSHWREDVLTILQALEAAGVSYEHVTIYGMTLVPDPEGHLIFTRVLNVRTRHSTVRAGLAGATTADLPTIVDRISTCCSLTH